MNHTSGYIALINELKKTVAEKDVATVKHLLELENNNELRLIDVRETEEWDEGYIPGAIHLSKGIIERDIEKIIPNKEQEIILYCRGGMRSIIAADTLQKMGYKDVTSMEGGFNAWLMSDYEVCHD